MAGGAATGSGLGRLRPRVCPAAGPPGNSSSLGFTSGRLDFGEPSALGFAVGGSSIRFATTGRCAQGHGHRPKGQSRPVAEQQTNHCQNPSEEPPLGYHHARCARMIPRKQNRRRTGEEHPEGRDIAKPGMRRRINPGIGMMQRRRVKIGTPAGSFPPPKAPPQRRRVQRRRPGDRHRRRRAVRGRTTGRGCGTTSAIRVARAVQALWPTPAPARPRSALPLALRRAAAGQWARPGTSTSCWHAGHTPVVAIWPAVAEIRWPQ